MGKIGDITTLVLVIGGGYLLLKNWEGIKGFFGSFSGLLGGEPGTGGGLSSAVFQETDVPLLDAPLEEGGQLTGEVGTIPSFLDLALGGTITPSPQYIPLPTPDDPVPSFWDLMNPFKGVTGSPPAPTPSYTPSETVTTPLGTTGWMQTTDMVSDVGRFDDPFDTAVKRRWIGGR